MDQMEIPNQKPHSSSMLSSELLNANAGGEDENVRDLARHLRAQIGPGDNHRRSKSPPAFRLRDDLLDPEVGRLRDVAQPGGFRRHHLQATGNSNQNAYADSQLVALLACSFGLRSQRDDAESEVSEVPAGTASKLSTGIILTKCFCSTSFLFMGRGFHDAGMLLGPLMLIIVFVFEITRMLQLIECREVMGVGYDYEDMGYPAFGLKGVYYIRFVKYFVQVGISAVYMVQATENLQILLPDWTTAERLWILFPAIVPFLWVRNMNAFAKVYGFTMIGILIVACSCIYFEVSEIMEKGAKPVELINTDNWDSLMWLGSCSYVYELINAILPIYEASKDKAAMKRQLVTIGSAATVFFVCFGCLVYFAYGPDTRSLATLSFPEESLARVIIPPLLTLICVLSMPINPWLIYQMYESNVPWSEVPLTRKWQKNITRAVVMALIVGLVQLGGQELQNFLGVVGGYGCANLAIIVPSMLHTRICKPGFRMRMLNLFCTVSGVLMCILSVYQSLASWGKASS